ncbi:Phosphoribosylaminoimidazole-succinocarboxamide synthase [Candida viswanathii]|uniref:Phosphoribosylaminoimidazole-succinocarboxamide synthase n=1 Tax=Candida viswanathii TaxID=5486 RepID=A0A367YPN2_9ASCO|nr:Phosphoribosylaminoimidazole-succinocarboxamide synthase [Candida viswanathii]
MTSTNLEGTFPLIARGKVRDIYQVDPSTLLFVATDRISAYDVIMANGIPAKGKILTKLSEFWFDFLPIANHLVPGDIFAKYPQLEPYRAQLAGRALLVRKLKLIPLEVIVRGYITGSGWKEYVRSGTVHGKKLPEGIQESLKLEPPIFTPSTKAEQGEHDENISKEQADEIVGKELCDRVEKIAVELYTRARDYAATKGIIIADTKFEFGLDEDDNIVLVDEVLTPDSSRFWNAAKYEVGKGQESYDKQFLRDWLTETGVAGKDGVAMPEDIVTKTKEKYVEAYESLTGEKWVD